MTKNNSILILVALCMYTFLTSKVVKAQNITSPIEIDESQEAVLITYYGDTIVQAEVLKPVENLAINRDQNKVIDPNEVGSIKKYDKLIYPSDKQDDENGMWSGSAPKLFPKQLYKQWDSWEFVANYRTEFLFTNYDLSEKKYFIDAEISKKFQNKAMIFFRLRLNQDKTENYHNEIYTGMGLGMYKKLPSGKEIQFKTFIGYRVKSDFLSNGGADSNPISILSKSNPEATFEITTKAGQKMYVTYGLSYSWNKLDEELGYKEDSDHLNAYIESQWGDKYVFRLNYDHEINNSSDEEEEDIFSIQFVRRF